LLTLHSQRAPAWRYYFSYVPTQLRAREPGVPHGGEIAFTLGTADFIQGYKNSFTDADRAILQRVNAYWFEFARAGKPQVDGNPMWQGDDERNDVTMALALRSCLQRDFMRHRLDVFIGFLKMMEWMLHR
jgi:para-nitrobenzyl esterase